MYHTVLTMPPSAPFRIIASFTLLMLRNSYANHPSEYSSTGMAIYKKIGRLKTYLPTVPDFPGQSRNSATCPGVPELLQNVLQFLTHKHELCTFLNYKNY